MEEVRRLWLEVGGLLAQANLNAMIASDDMDDASAELANCGDALERVGENVNEMRKVLRGY